MNRKQLAKLSPTDRAILREAAKIKRRLYEMLEESPSKYLYITDKFYQVVSSFSWRDQNGKLHHGLPPRVRQDNVGRVYVDPSTPAVAILARSESPDEGNFIEITEEKWTPETGWVTLRADN